MYILIRACEISFIRLTDFFPLYFRERLVIHNRSCTPFKPAKAVGEAGKKTKNNEAPQRLLSSRSGSRNLSRVSKYMT